MNTMRNCAMQLCIYQTAVTLTKSVSAIVELLVLSCPDTQIVLSGLLIRGMQGEPDPDKYSLPNR